MAAGGGFYSPIDQTSSSRQGEKTPNTFSTGNRTRRPRKGHRYGTKKSASKRCHAFVCGLLLTPSGLRIPYRRSYYTHEYCKEKGYDHRTQAELGADMVTALELPDAAEVVVLGDTAYEAKCVREACDARGWTWIVPGNPERVLAGPKPRPKLRSLLQDISKQRFTAVKVHPDTDPYAPQRRASESARDRTGKGRTYYVWKKRVAVHSIGVVSVFVSTTEKPEAGRPLHKPKILLSNDPGLTAREAVLRYTLRWQIETYQPDYTSSERWAQPRFLPYHQRNRAARVGDLVPTTARLTRWRDRMSDPTSVPPRARTIRV